MASPEPRRRRGRRGALAAAATVLCAAVIVPAELASPRPVASPGGVTATATSGTIRVGEQTFNFTDPITFTNGQVETTGTITFPADSQSCTSNCYFPAMQLDGLPLVGSVTVRIRVAPPGVTGNINPLTGVLNLRLPVWIKIDGLGGCRIGSSSSPIVVDPLTTGTSGPLSGTAYNPSNGTAKVVKSGFSVPGAQDCTYSLIGVNGQVNDAVGIPTSNTEAQLNLAFNPIIAKGINASFTVNGGSSVNDKAPLLVNFNPSASVVHAGVRQCATETPSSPNCGYRWDFNNDGIDDAVRNTPATVQHTYNTVGTHTARLRVYDIDGDFDQTTRVITTSNPDLAIAKSHTGVFAVGSQGSYTLQASNPSTAATSGAVTVTDTLPAGLGYAGATGTGWGCGAAGQTVTCTRTASIAGGASAPPIALNVNVGPAAYPEVTNEAAVSAVGNPDSTTDTDPTTVVAPDLEIEKAHQGDFRTGAIETWQLEVTNVGTAATTGVATVTDTLPGGVSYQGFSAPEGWSCSAAGQLVTCTIPAGIAPSDGGLIELHVVAGTAAMPAVTNTAQVSTPNDPIAANNSSSDPTNVTAAVDLTLAKTHAAPFRVGSTGEYTVTVTNRGGRPSAGTTIVTDSVPEGLDLIGASGAGWDCDTFEQEVTCSSEDSLGANQSAPPITIETLVQPEAQPVVTNTASVATQGTGDDVDVNPTNDSGSDVTPITATDLAISKTHVGGFPIGGEGTYNLTVQNVGSAPTVGPTTVTDVLPAELSYVSATGAGWSCDDDEQEVTCVRAASIAAGAIAPSISLVVAVADTEEEEIVNTASVSTADDVNPENDSAEDPTPVTAADLELTKSHSGDFRVGATRAYVLRVKNVGSQTAGGPTTVTDELPDGLTYVAATGSGWSCDDDGQEVSCERAASIPSGIATPPITIQAEVGVDAYPGVVNSASVSNQDDRNDANDFAVDPTAVTASDLALTKSHQGALQVNDRATYRIDVDNVGSAATDAPATVTDTLPEGLSYAGSPSAEWSCEADGQDVSCDYTASIPAGGSAPTLALRADVDSSAASEVTNVAEVSIYDDPVSGNDSDEDTADVGRIDLAAEKSAQGELVRGASGSYEIEIANLGTDPTKGPARVTDALPEGLSYAGASGAGWSCSVSSGTVECLYPATIAAGESAPPIALDVNVAPDAPDSIENVASVQTAGDADGSNDAGADDSEVVGTIDASVALQAQLPASGAFRVGTRGAYNLTVHNTGTIAAPGPIAATVALPSGLSYVSGQGAGWSCSAVGQQVSCDRTDPLPVGSRSDVTLEVNVGTPAVPGVTANAELSAPGDAVEANNSASATTGVTMIDLAVSMQGPSGVVAVNGAGAFAIQVQNQGSAATISPTTVSGQLPAGLSYRGASGPGWSCSAAGRQLSCIRAASLGAGEAAAPIALQVSPAASIANRVTLNSVAVATKDDAEPANNGAAAGITVGPAPRAKPKPKRCKKGFKKVKRKGKVRCVKKAKKKKRGRR